VRTVQIRPTETAAQPAEPTLAVTANGRQVIVNGTASAGRQSPTADLGTHTITVRGSGGERQFTVDATMKPVQLDVDFSKP
jgi:hypothetical protein